MIQCRKIPTAVSDVFCTVGMTAKTELGTLLVAENAVRCIWCKRIISINSPIIARKNSLRSLWEHLNRSKSDTKVIQKMFKKMLKVVPICMQSSRNQQKISRRTKKERFAHSHRIITRVPKTLVNKRKWTLRRMSILV